MAVSHISTSGATGLTASTVSVDVNTTAADHVHINVLMRNNDQTISSVTREGAATTQVGTDSTTSGERVSCGMRRSAGAGVAADTFTATLSGSTPAVRIVVTAMSSVDSGAPLVSSDTNGNIGTVDAFIDTDSTTVASGNLAICAIVVRDDVSGSLADNGGANTTDRDAIANLASEVTTYVITFTDTRTVRFSWTEPGAGNWAKTMTAVYKASAAATARPVFSRRPLRFVA